MPPGFSRPPVTSYPSQEPRYAPSGSYIPSHDGAPPGYVRQGNCFVPISTYEAAPATASRSEAPSYGAFGQPTQAPPRGDGRGDPRYPPTQQDFDPRYAYPSPAATVSSTVAPRDRERDQIASPQQSSGYSQTFQAQYDQYGRQNPSQPRQPERSGRGASANVSSAYGGGRQPVSGSSASVSSTYGSRPPVSGSTDPYRTTTSSSNESHRSSRRRVG